MKVLDVYDPSAVKLLAFFKINIYDIVAMVCSLLLILIFLNILLKACEMESNADGASVRDAYTLHDLVVFYFIFTFIVLLSLSHSLLFSLSLSHSTFSSSLLLLFFRFLSLLFAFFRFFFVSSL